MRRFLPLIALGCGAWLAFTASTIPAATVLRWFAPDTVRVSDVSGTIWSGSAALASVDGFPLRDLRWQIDALPLLLARLSGSAEADFSNGFVNTQFSVAGDTVSLSALQLSTSVATLANVMPVSGVSGGISAQLDSLTLASQWPTDAAGAVRISNLIVEPLPGLGTVPMALGSFEVTLIPTDGQGLRGAIADLGGPLEVAAELSLSPTREYQLNGTVRERSSAPEELVHGLNFMTGAPDAQGRRELTFAGSL